MKELSIEEKAARYDKAIEKLRSLHDNYDTVSTLIDIKEELEQIFPELKESDDEKTRKEIIDTIHRAAGNSGVHISEFLENKYIVWLEKQGKNNMGISEATKQKLEDNLRKALEKETPESWNAFLDEQGEQKPTDEEMKILLQTEYEKGKADALQEQRKEWTAEDLLNRNQIADILQEYNRNDLIKWLEKQSEKGTNGNEREIPNPVWSEEDEYVYNEILKRVADKKLYEHDLEYIYKWLNSLRPQPQWKPSESDILLLERIANGKSNPKDFQASLGGLIGQLKKLRKE